MSAKEMWTYVVVMIVVTNLIRVLPMMLIRGEIKNLFIRSFLHYVPYVTLAVMTFPSIVTSTRLELAGALALLGGGLAAWKGLGLFPVSIICCCIVLVTEHIAM